MSNPVQSIHAVSASNLTQQATPKAQPPATQPPATPQDSVTISPQAQQKLASTKPAVSGDVDHDGDSR